MSAKKKRNALSECPRCACYFLNRDFERHPEDCTIDAGTSHIRPQSTFVATSCLIEKRETHLPSDSIGWSTHNNVLLHSSSLELLGVLPRTPCLLSSDGIKSRIVVVWPCAEINPLKVSVQGLVAERNVRLDVIKEFTELKSLQLCPSDEIEERLLSADHFINYVKVYLSSGFVSPKLPSLEVKYLSRTYHFDVYEDNADRLTRLNIGKDSYAVYSLAHNFQLSFVENFR